MDTLFTCGVGLVMLIIGVIIGRWTFRARGGGNIIIDGRRYFFYQRELEELSDYYTPDESAVVREVQSLVNRGRGVPQELSDSAAAALENAVRRWMAAHPNQAKKKGYVLPS